MSKIQEKKPLAKLGYTVTISNCTKCSFHEIQPDPDPSDWFCDDDVKVVCTKKQKNITVACRPYNIKKECDIPTWCPLIKEFKEQNKTQNNGKRNIKHPFFHTKTKKIIKQQK